MNPSEPQSVCVIIAAKDAVATVGRAVRSALAETRVGEVVVIDDGSRDGTARAAADADDGSGRLDLVELPGNRGPACARNLAIARSKSPLVAVLDSDDFILPGRFDPLLDGDDWDFVADNILFTDGRDEAPAVPLFAPEPALLSLEDFVTGNLTSRGKPRAELGFLKPVMRRSFLDRHSLRYDETLRLGEDYDLYSRALARGARFRLVRSCGYAAVVRSDSLSGRHETADLERLWGVDRALLGSAELASGARAALRLHARQIRDRYELRRFLDTKRERGLATAALGAFTRPAAIPAIASGVLRDKLDDLRSRGRAGHSPVIVDSAPRCLLPGRLAMSD